ncbi:MAG: hypothetical protein ACLGIM_16310 [Alphaproteobacteria bacterium]
MKQPTPKRRRNPVARELLTNPAFRPQIAPSKKERAQQRDRQRNGWDRNAKHKGSLPEDPVWTPPDDP